MFPADSPRMQPFIDLARKSEDWATFSRSMATHRQACSAFPSLHCTHAALHVACNLFPRLQRFTDSDVPWYVHLPISSCLVDSLSLLTGLAPILQRSVATTGLFIQGKVNVVLEYLYVVLFLSTLVVLMAQTLKSPPASAGSYLVCDNKSYLLALLPPVCLMKVATGFALLKSSE
jgi:hypothetical protein